MRLSTESSLDIAYDNGNHRAVTVLMRAREKNIIKFEVDNRMKEWVWLVACDKKRTQASRGRPATTASKAAEASVVKQTRASKRLATKTVTQERAMKHILNMETGTSIALLHLGPYKKDEPEPYGTCGRTYPLEYCGNGRCHLRALFNVNERAAAVACQENIKYQNNNGVTKILHKHKRDQESTGLVFRIENHWVTIKSDEGTNEGIYYDD